MVSTLTATQGNPVRQQPSASGRALAGAVSLMTHNVTTAPRFSKDQRVCFLGGMGIIRSCQLDAKLWTYAVEMELGPEPEVGRIGNETTILLQEADIQHTEGGPSQ